MTQALPESAAFRKGDNHPFTNTGRASALLAASGLLKYKYRSPGVHTHSHTQAHILTYTHTRAHYPLSETGQHGKKSKAVKWGLWTEGFLFGLPDHRLPSSTQQHLRWHGGDMRRERPRALILCHLRIDTYEF